MNIFISRLGLLIVGTILQIAALPDTAFSATKIELGNDAKLAKMMRELQRKDNIANGQDIEISPDDYKEPNDIPRYLGELPNLIDPTFGNFTRALPIVGKPFYSAPARNMIRNVLRRSGQGRRVQQNAELGQDVMDLVANKLLTLQSDAFEKQTRELFPFLDKKSLLRKSMEQVNVEAYDVDSYHDYLNSRSKVDETRFQLDLRKLVQEKLAQQRDNKLAQFLPGLDPFYNPQLDQEIEQLERDLARLEGSAPSQACGPMSEDEKAWIIANKDSNFENYLVGLEGSRTNLKHMTTYGGYFKPDVDSTRAWVAHAENKIAEMLEEARSALGSCPQTQTQDCGVLTDDERKELDSALGQSPEEFEQYLEQSRRYLEDFRVSYTQFKNEGSLPADRADAEIQYVETSYKEAVKRYENAINKLSSRQGCPPYQLGGAFPQSGSTASPALAHQDRQSAENDSQTGGNNTNYASEDENLPAGFRRVGPNTCVNNISDFIRC
ncbi:hypothetical protein [uncultured Roseibium sp.]|uniref:hypothetical protein n=1 Tax=uncultured Roseibium sp. TaxID=1936171 RepID=UPI0032171FE1